MKRVLGWLFIVALIGAAIFYGRRWWEARARAEQPVYSTAPVRRGDLVASVEATGTIEPEDLVDIGAQVAGRIIEFGKDTDGKEIDYGSHVNEGVILAKIDDVV